LGWEVIYSLRGSINDGTVPEESSIKVFKVISLALV
jgi:hypothetical protein